MDEAKPTEGKLGAGAAGGIGGIAGVLVGAVIMFASVDKTELVTEATITNPLAVCSVDSMAAAKTLIYDKVDPKDTTKIVKDTVVIPSRPALKGFSENGVSDYAIAKVLVPGKKYQLLLLEDGVAINATEYSELKKQWLLSIRPTATVYGE